MSPLNLLNSSPDQFIQFLKEQRISSFHLVPDSQNSLRASHPGLQEMANVIAADKRDFQAHEGVFFRVNSSGDTLLAAFIHKTCRGPAAGGVRYWSYDSMAEVLSDGLRLAAGMTRKNALAGLWWGGGKGLMARATSAKPLMGDQRKALYCEYGELISDLKGCYYTAEDVGTGPADMAEIHSRTRFVTCIPPELGGSGNPSAPTAGGVAAAMTAALEFCGLGSLKGRSIALQGLGHVAQPLLAMLFEGGVARVTATDIDPELVALVRSRFSARQLDARCVTRDDQSIFGVQADIFAPCATGAILNPETIPQLKCSIVCGAANNQLQDPLRDDRALVTRGITYVPDFLCNRMGIVNCADEGAGSLPDDPLILRHLDREWEHSIHQTTVRVLQQARDTAVPPGQIATALADELAGECHPLMGHRGVQIIGALVARMWYN